MTRYGIRIHAVDGNHWIVKQMVKLDGARKYATCDDRIRFVRPEDDAAIAQAVRDGMAGRLETRPLPGDCTAEVAADPR